MTTPMQPLIVIGGGNMAQAMVRGGLDARILAADRLAVVEPDGDKRDLFRSWGVRAVKHPDDLASWVGEQDSARRGAQVLLAVKPQSIADVAAQAIPLLRERRVITSILAGVTTDALRSRLGDRHAYIRAMPNTGARLRRSTTAVALGAGAGAGDDALAVALFSAIGHVVSIGEPMMDAFTAVAGSGPAYVYYLAEAMAAAARDLGFEPELALRIVRSTIAAAGAMLEETQGDPRTLRAAVTSKGGTTAAAVAVLDQARVKETIQLALHAARDRGAELSRMA